MSMLAEKKRKTKWVINPTKKPIWNTDSNGIKFGKELMEKMGWSAGKGLGANEQGIQEPLKVSYKNDTKGMGFKGNDNEWIEHQDEFNCFLNELRNSDDSVVVKTSDVEKNEVKSLEEKSKWSKARVHYQKFTRGKDLSKYSEKDLACIIGTNEDKKEKSKSDEGNLAKSETNGNLETHFGVTTINSGSIQDYFKEKLRLKKKNKESSGEGYESPQNCPDEDSSFLVYDKENVQKKEHSKKKKKNKVCSEECNNVEATITHEPNELEKTKEKKKKREKDLISEEEPEIKKRKRIYDIDTVNNTSEVAVLDSVVKEKKSKKKVRESENNDCDVEIVGIENQEISEFSDFVKKKKKVIDADNNTKELLVDEDENKDLKHKKKKKKNKEKEELENNEFSVVVNTPSVNLEKSYLNEEEGACNKETNEISEPEFKVKKKKKKSKKEKQYENDETRAQVFLDDLNSEAVDFPNSEPPKKKKKKEKKEKTSEKEVECFQSNSLEVTNSSAVDENVESLNKEEVKLVMKQKRKKNKKEKLINPDEIECTENVEKERIENFDEVKPIKHKSKKKDKRETSGEKESIEDNNEVKVSEVECIKKKKMKKERKEIENFEISESEIHGICFEESISKKKRKATQEIELDTKKKMKKSKKDIESIELIENNDNQVTNAFDEKMEGNFQNESKKNLLLEEELVKKKKKKKKKKKEKEEIIGFVDNCNSHIMGPHSVEENYDAGEIEITSEAESVKKRKKKKNKEKSVDNEKVENTNKVEVILDEESFKKKKRKDKNKEVLSDDVGSKSKSFCSEGEKNDVASEKNEVASKKNAVASEKKSTEEAEEEKKYKNSALNKESIENTSNGNHRANFNRINKNNFAHHTNNYQKNNLYTRNNLNLSQIGSAHNSFNFLQNKLNYNMNGLNFLLNNSGFNLSNLNFPQNNLGYNLNFPQNNLGFNLNNLNVSQNNLVNHLNSLNLPINNYGSFLNHTNLNILNLLNFINSYKYYNNSLNLGNGIISGENGVQNHKVELLNEKKADKFYPGQNKSEKILRLMHLADFSEFNGSNLEKVVGYGFQKPFNNNDESR